MRNEDKPDTTTAPIEKLTSDQLVKIAQDHPEFVMALSERNAGQPREIAGAHASNNKNILYQQPRQTGPRDDTTKPETFEGPTI